MGQPRASWTGAIQFGLVSIGVQLIAMTVDPEPEFVSVHASCLAPLRQDRVCTAAKCGRTLTAAEIVKAVKSGNEYIRVSDEEIAALATSSRKVLKLDQYPAWLSVDLTRIERAYWVVPATAGDAAAFTTLRRALEERGLAAMGKIAFRSRERIAAITVVDGHMELYALHFPDEIRDALSAITAAYRPEDVKAAAALIDEANASAKITRTGQPNLERYRDDYTDGLQALVRLKIARPPASTMPLGKQLAESVRRERRRARVKVV